METSLILGVTGATIILVFFLLNQIHKIDRDNILYDLANFVGASLLLVYAVLISSIPFIILNAVWALFSLKDMIAYFTKN